jgi:hypothetical protein
MDYEILIGNGMRIDGTGALAKYFDFAMSVVAECDDPGG